MIIKKLDGSYITTGGTYHAHQYATPEAWKAADEYAVANPDMVDLELPPLPPTAEEITANRILEINSELAGMDRTMPRALEDLYEQLEITPHQRNADVVAQKKALRAELVGLKGVR